MGFSKLHNSSIDIVTSKKEFLSKKNDMLLQPQNSIMTSRLHN